MFQRGSNGSPAGVTGTITQPGFGGKVQCVVYGWSTRGKGEYRERYGRNTSGIVNYRLFKKIRHGTFEGVITPGAPPGKTPAPPEASGIVGGAASLVLQYHTNLTITYSIILDLPDISAIGDAKKQTTTEPWILSGSFRIVGEPVYSDGWGTQPADTTPTKTDSREYDGTSFTHDPDDLQTNAQITVDWWALTTNDDATLKTRLTDAIAVYVATEFDSHLKNRLDTIHQDADDGGVMVFRFALTTTKEDALNEATGRTVDPSALQSHETTAAFNTTPSSGSISGLVSRGVSFREYNDNEVMQVKNWGQTTTQEDWEFPRTITNEDLSTIPLQKETTEGHVTSSATPSNPTPSGTYKLRSRNKVQLTDAGKYGHHYVMGLTTPQEDEENQSSIIHADANAIGSYEIHGRVVATASTADPSGAPSGMSLVDTDTKEIHDNAFHRIYKYGLLTTLEKIQHDGTSTSYDVTDDKNGTPTSRLATVGTGYTVSDTTATLGDTRRASLIADKRYIRTATRKLNKTVALFLDQYRNDDFKYSFSTWSPINGERRPTDSTYAYVKIGDVRLLPGSVYEYFLVPRDVFLTRGKLILYRLFSDTTEQNVLQSAKFGLLNDNTTHGSGVQSYPFLNLAVFQSIAPSPLRFDGCDIIDNATWNGTSHAFFVRYKFDYCSIGFGEQSAIPLGQRLYTTTAITAGSDAAATTLNANWGIQRPSTTSFVNFVT